MATTGFGPAAGAPGGTVGKSAFGVAGFSLTPEPEPEPQSTEGGILPGPEATAYDFEAPNGTQVLYRARALHDYGGTYGASPWTTEPGEWSSGDWWLKCPASPALNQIVNVHSQTGVQRKPRRGTFQAVGASYPIVVSTTRASDEGPIVFRTDDDLAITELLALADSGKTLMLQAPPSDHWPDRYVELGDADMARYTDKSFVAEHLHAYQWTEVATPDDPVDEWPELGS